MILALLSRYWSHAGLAVALMLLAVASMGWRAEKALRARDRASYGHAQADAALLARQALEATEARYRDKANDADQTYAKELAGARSATGLFIARNRVRREAVACPASGAPSSAEGSSAPSPDRSSAAPDLVEVTADDVQVCTINTLRLETARDWALSLP